MMDVRIEGKVHVQLDEDTLIVVEKNHLNLMFTVKDMTKQDEDGLIPAIEFEMTRDEVRNIGQQLISLADTLR